MALREKNALIYGKGSKGVRPRQRRLLPATARRWRRLAVPMERRLGGGAPGKRLFGKIFPLYWPLAPAEADRTKVVKIPGGRRPVPGKQAKEAADKR